MSKWKDKQMAAPLGVAPIASPEAPSLPEGRWFRVARVTENGTSGRVLDELIQNSDGSFTVKRLHGPDLPQIVGVRLHQEALNW